MPLFLSEATLTPRTPFSEPLSAHEPRAVHGFSLTNPKEQPAHIVSTVFNKIQPPTKKTRPGGSFWILAVFIFS